MRLQRVTTGSCDRALGAASASGLDVSDAITRYNPKSQLGVQPSVNPREVGQYQAIHIGPDFAGTMISSGLLVNREQLGS